MQKVIFIMVALLSQISFAADLEKINIYNDTFKRYAIIGRPLTGGEEYKILYPGTSITLSCCREFEVVEYEHGQNSLGWVENPLDCKKPVDVNLSSVLIGMLLDN